MGVREKKLKQQLGRVCGLGGPQAGLGEAGFPVGTVEWARERDPEASIRSPQENGNGGSPAPRCRVN